MRPDRTYSLFGLPRWTLHSGVEGLLGGCAGFVNHPWKTDHTVPGLLGQTAHFRPDLGAGSRREQQSGDGSRHCAAHECEQHLTAPEPLALDENFTGLVFNHDLSPSHSTRRPREPEMHVPLMHCRPTAAPIAEATRIL